MLITAVPNSFDRTVEAASVLLQAVLDGVPGERCSGQFLGGRVDLAGPQRLVGCRKHMDHCLLDSAGSPSQLALRMGFRPRPRRERPGQQVGADKPGAVQTCPVFFHPLSETQRRPCKGASLQVRSLGEEMRLVRTLDVGVRVAVRLGPLNERPAQRGQPLRSVHRTAWIIRLSLVMAVPTIWL